MKFLSGLVNVVAMLLSFVDFWLLFKKMGHFGWKGIIPGYNLWLLFGELYGNPKKVFLLLIPGYNIYVYVKMMIDWAHKFNKSTGYGWGLALLYPVFGTMLSLGDAVYEDGSKANTGADWVTNLVAKAVALFK